MTEQAQQPLNEREREILQLIANGLSNSQIAERLSLSLNTVKWYLKRIYVVLGVERRTQAVAAARARGLLDGDTPPGPALPIPATPFIGRQKELAQVLELLDDPDTRLVSIVGPGGIGKTRLALAAAAQFQANAQRPVYFVALEGIQQPEGVIPAIAGVIGFQFGGQKDLHQQLLTGLSNRAMLLVLDNCEHVLEAMSLVGEMLTISPNLQVLTTSRERLNLSGETLFHLEGLAYPTQPQTALEFEALRLFLQTVHRPRPNFEPTQDDWLHISHICQLVEGMPLAIELAAGWTDVLSLGEIADNLQQDIRFLKTSARDVPHRHRSMTAVFEQSWQLMSEAEQTVFKKLSVFRGGFDRAAAEAVAGASPDILKELLAKSRITEIQPGRWKLHELLRQFAETKLRADLTEHTQTVRAHCQYYGHLMRQYEQAFETDLAAFDGYVAEAYQDFDNILSGWNSAIHQPFIGEIGNYVTMLCFLMQERGLHQLALQAFVMVQQLYDEYPAQVTIRDRLNLLIYHGMFASMLSRTDDGRQRLEQADAYTTHLAVEAWSRLGILWSFLGWTLHLHGEPALARKYLSQGVKHCRKSNFAFGEWGSLAMSALVEFCVGNYEAADQHALEALIVAQHHKFLRGVWWIDALRANVLFLLGHQQAAHQLWYRTLMSQPETLPVDPIIIVIVGIALLFEQKGQLNEALDLLALVIHHQQAQSPANQQALHVLQRLHDQFSEQHINAVLEKAKQGKLSTPYFASNFTIDRALIDTLLMLLDELAPEDEE
ncbi:MAG: LuxR C-terminal-related transcriptional regulator [Chloroflexi bacterium]|nr:LuxR C-terminal-related transcriptional regulator [Chloroflexota bacterium]